MSFVSLREQITSWTLQQDDQVLPPDPVLRSHQEPLRDNFRVREADQREHREYKVRPQGGGSQDGLRLQPVPQTIRAQVHLKRIPTSKPENIGASGQGLDSREEGRGQEQQQEQDGHLQGGSIDRPQKPGDQGGRGLEGQHVDRKRIGVFLRYEPGRLQKY